MLLIICREGNGNLLQCSCLESPMDREAWWAAVHGVPQGRARLKRLSMHTCTDNLYEVLRFNTNFISCPTFSLFHVVKINIHIIQILVPINKGSLERIFVGVEVLQQQNCSHKAEIFPADFCPSGRGYRG